MQVYSSISQLQDYNVKWLKPRCVCRDIFGESQRPRHDAVLIKTLDGSFVFAQLLLIFAFQKRYSLCYTQVYEDVTPGQQYHGLSDERHVKLGNHFEMYPFSFVFKVFFLIFQCFPVEYVMGNCYLLEDPASLSASPTFFIHTGIHETNTWKPQYDVEYEYVHITSPPSPLPPPPCLPPLPSPP